MEKLVRTLLVEGGEPVVLTPKGNLPLDHDGGVSIFHPVLTPSQLESVIEAFEKVGAKVSGNTGGHNAGQEKARLLMLGRTVSAPCSMCARCAHYTHPPLCDFLLVPEGDTCDSFVSRDPT